MASPPVATGLAALSRSGPTDSRSAPSVPRPAFRWGTRIGLPTIILFAAAGVLAWSARDALWPAIEVRVAPAVPHTQSVASGEDADAVATADTRETTLVQAPGWVEPAPYATAVPALTDGVIREVLALEGQTVQAGEVIARLIDDDARLALKKAEAVLAERGAAAAQAAAMHEAAEARAAEIRDELRRKSDLSNDGTFAEATVARLELRLRGLEADVAAAAAGQLAAIAAQHIAEVEVELASLALARTEIRAPISGVVLSRSIEPGTRLTMAGPGPGEAHESGVVRIYDPSSLQVRVDVPLADAAKVGLGAAAKIVSESLPETTFSGTVSRVVHEANIQRNTVQFKVSIENPAAALKPEMLVRVRIMGNTSGSAGGVHESTAENEPGSGVLLPELAVQQTGEGRGTAWMVAHDARGRTIAMRRELRLGSRHADGYIEVVSGAAPTDRAIVNPPAGLANGTRVRIVGEAASKPEESP